MPSGASAKRQTVSSPFMHSFAEKERARHGCRAIRANDRAAGYLVTRQLPPALL
ncbi:hypothetical protein EKH55_1303 [Sinorhizobium alkalisoli]|nr:hypothetical protein EKH55_1303 [Sinorhizobium alkalisoli]